MGYRDQPYEIISKALQDIYQSPDVHELYSALFKSIAELEAIELEPNPDEAKKIFNGLLSLHAFLEKNNRSVEAENLLAQTIITFPHFYFPRPPKARLSENPDTLLLQSAREALRLKAAPEKPLMALTLFEEQFRKASINLPLLAAEIASGSFCREGPGRAGELFRSFADIAAVLQDTSARDAPWELMLQLAVKMNNTVSGFNQSYLILKALETVKTSRPAGWLLGELARNQAFFQRNHCWKNIDEACIAGDENAILFWADKALPLVNETFERDYLLQLRNNAASKIVKPGNSSVMLVVVVILIVIACVGILQTESDVKRKLNLEATRKEILQAVKAGIKPAEKPPEPEPVPQVVISQPPIKSRSGLLEFKPPLRPHSRRLTLPEVRHAIFQKERLAHLKAQSLSKSEAILLEELEKDWRSRCEFYEYSNEDREKVFWDLQIHSINLQLDAMDILNSWRKEPDYEGKILESGVTLDFSNALHFQIAVNRLKTLGFLRTDSAPKYWDEQCARALMEFKATNLSIQDAVWDRKTQEAMFPPRLR
ncbi:MAG TPA: hypothetical protein PLM07_07270 [Candidatus Rifleibacterium sp.]|nr:hypothetical protein [Candidatus Rifleibacterium sp.]HPT45684.1 hypothetical protein [Candidatus Rifleibacterium sp.]